MYGAVCVCGATSEARPLVPLVGLPRVELGPLLRARLAAGDALFGLAQLGLVVVHQRRRPRQPALVLLAARLLR